MTNYRCLNGFKINGMHTYNDFGFITATRDIPFPEKKTIIETVPYSNVEYDFSLLYGKQLYERIDATITFLYIGNSEDDVLKHKDDFVKFWYSIYGSVAIYDDELGADKEGKYHWVGRVVSITKSSAPLDERFCTKIDVQLSLSPNLVQNFEKSKFPYPDINNDGVVDTIDSNLILDAYLSISSGDSNYNDYDAIYDVNKDGKIDTNDASLIISFYTQCSSGLYTNNPGGWEKFMENNYNG